jgi:uncharacterized protein
MGERRHAHAADAVKVAARTLRLLRESPHDLEPYRVAEALEHGRKRELRASRMLGLAHARSIASVPRCFDDRRTDSLPSMSKQLLQRVYTEVSRGNPQPLIDSLAEDVQWTIIGSTPLSRTYHGKHEVLNGLLAGIRARLAGALVFSFQRFIAEGEYVVMQATGTATAISGRPYNNTYCVVARIVDGKIHEMTDYADTELVTTALFGDSND